MESTPLIDLESIAKQLKLPVPSVQRAAELLDEGNTVPFITRFRKDQTGGLDEQQTRAIEFELKRAKLLAERKETILKSIESRGKLTEKLAAQIRRTRVLGDLEDIYLPYKPKKQSHASVARARGLEPFAISVLEAKEPSSTLEEMAASFIDESKDVATVEVAIEGLKHLIAEHFGHHRQVRSQLRRHLSKNGKLVCKKIEQPLDEPSAPADAESDDAAKLADESAAPRSHASEVTAEVSAATSQDGVAKMAADDGIEATASDGIAIAPAPAASLPETPDAAASEAASVDSNEVSEPIAGTDESTSSEATTAEVNTAEVNTAEVSTAEVSTAEVSTAEDEVCDPARSQEEDSAETATATQTSGQSPDVTDEQASQTSPGESVEEPAKVTPQASGKKENSEKGDATSRRDQRRELRRRRRERLVQSFKDYFDFSDPIGRLPHHRILAINRGERTKVLRVKVECPDWDRVQLHAEKVAFRPDHPFADFLRECLHDAMQRLLQPSIEREVRRDLNEQAEEHAVAVFARNLRKLLLQPPLRNHRVVAIDPGFRSGCKVVALDAFGQLLGHTFINLLGKDQQKQNGRVALAKFVKEHQATVIAVGNGAASRETETLVAEVLGDELKDQQVGYLIVNEAGTSVYSTSELGREELPDMDATLRSAVSIGRRALDPLSELVKIDPANIGVGLYQHDVKAKHLRESLDNVVESCVNYVGVDVNSASPALLRYVSGLNTLTARKIYEHRMANGPFKNREQLKEVSGIGESTYVQAAGFLKIVGGENPLDGTWIHPESYETATKVLDAIGFNTDDLRQRPVEPVTLSASTLSAETDVPQTEADASTNSPTDVEAKTVTAEDESSAESHETGNITEPTATASSDDVTVDSELPSPSEENSSEAPAKDRDDTQIHGKPQDEQLKEHATAVEENNSVETSAQAAHDSAGPNCLANSSRMKEINEKLSAVVPEELAGQLGVGKLSLEDILNNLARPGRDPREDLPPPIFRTGVLKLDDLRPSMELSGTVLNVVDFGAFVDIGLVDSGLIHVSRLADRYISDPHDVVSVGDILRVWVVEVDQKRRRVSLTAIEPGTERPKTAREDRRRKGRRDSQPKGAQKTNQGETGQGGKGRPPRRGRGAGKGQRPKHHRTKAPPKPVVPITKEMEEGTEPMRTFGDLKQLFDKKKRKGSK